MYIRCMNTYNVPPFPAQQFKLCLFVAWRVFVKKVLFNTLRSNISAIRSYHVDIGEMLDFSEMPGFQRTLRGAKRFLGISTDKRVAVTPVILSKLFRYLDRRSVHGALFRAAFSMAVFGLLRCSEFAWTGSDDPAKLLLRSSVSFAADDSGVKVNVSASKTDFFRKGCVIRIGCRCRPSSPDRICAVHELRNYMSLVHGLPNEPLFRVDGHILDRDMVVREILALCRKCGLDENVFKSQSFRKGGATALKNAGVPDSVIQVMGRWLSNAYRLYVQYSDEDVFKYSDMMK